MKRATVIWTTEALKDMDGIYDFIAEDSVMTAFKIINWILARTRQLELFPESGQQQYTLKPIQSYKYIVEGNYKIIYSYEKKVVNIHTIFDTRQDPEKLKV